MLLTNGFKRESTPGSIGRCTVLTKPSIRFDIFSVHNEFQVEQRVLKENERITNKIYQEINGISKPAATLDLQQLQNEGLISRVGYRALIIP